MDGKGDRADDGHRSGHRPAGKTGDAPWGRM